jgi:alpha-1,3-rhamnosyl/mannosyltransferase
VNVALDTNPLFTTRAGVARYVRGLLRGLHALGAPDLRLRELAWPVENLDYRQPRRAYRTLFRELIWAPLLAPRLLAAGCADLLHVTSAFPVRRSPSIRSVQTLYDLAVVRHPERYRPWQRLTGPRRLRAAARADRVIAISRFTADEAVSLLGLPAARIAVVRLGSDFSPDADPPIAELPPPTDLPDRFFLFVGSLEPGKNLALLRSAYALAAARRLDLPPLVIVGARWEGVAREPAPPPNWLYAGPQPDGVLLACYRRALALLFPSRYEGFGLPVLEAMSVGCPVVCSRVASLPEVGGEAVWYADQTPDAYLHAMIALAADSAAREDMRHAGLARAGRFTWRRCAQETLAVYREVLRC